LLSLEDSQSMVDSHARPIQASAAVNQPLYGTTKHLGGWSPGAVFSLSFTPQLTITRSAANVILSWPTNYAGFDYSGYTLESTTNLNPSVWNSNLPPPTTMNGQKSVTLPVTRTQQFFRLRQ
jgi:hypothetical protein